MELLSVSFVLPVLDAEQILPACLSSIRKQDYPAERYEILLADGGSTDQTLNIASRYQCTIIDAKGLMGEAAKQKAFSRATGKYIAMIDADNEIAESTWLKRAVSALEQHPKALGFESYYLKHPRHTRLNRYLTALLQISDPCARAMTGRVKLLSRNSDGVEVLELPANGSYPTGANGFIFRRELLNRLRDMGPYHEAAFFPSLMRSGIRNLVKIRGCGIYHHYVTGWNDYLKKRRRAMIVYMLRKEEISQTWDQEGIHLRKLWGMLYAASIIGPAMEGIRRAITERDSDWLLHPAAAAVSTIGNIWGVLDYRRLGSSEKRRRMTVKLQPRANEQGSP